MEHWITTDTHFGHSKLMEYSDRPFGFESLIMKRHSDKIKKDDVLIHLGDICIGDDEKWNQLFLCGIVCKKWLIRGNHDKRSDTWYLSNGWDFVGDSITLNRFGLNILFSHIPVIDNGYDLNIHGHFHNADHRRHEKELLSIKNNKQILVMLEHHYNPQMLSSIIKAKDKV